MRKFRGVAYFIDMVICDFFEDGKGEGWKKLCVAPDLACSGKCPRGLSGDQSIS